MPRTLAPVASAAKAAGAATTAESGRSGRSGDLALGDNIGGSAASSGTNTRREETASALEYRILAWRVILGGSRGASYEMRGGSKKSQLGVSRGGGPGYGRVLLLRTP